MKSFLGYTSFERHSFSFNLSIDDLTHTLILLFIMLQPITYVKRRTVSRSVMQRIVKPSVAVRKDSYYMTMEFAVLVSLHKVEIVMKVARQRVSKSWYQPKNFLLTIIIILITLITFRPCRIAFIDVDRALSLKPVGVQFTFISLKIKLLI